MTLWTPEIVRARFVEAVDTESRLPRGRVGTASGYWPGYTHSFEDMNGWGTKRLREERELQTRRLPPSSEAISRHDEVMTWTSTLIPDATRRRLVWAWALCRHSGKSFADWCRINGRTKITAYRHLAATVEAISESLTNDRVLLRSPDEKWVIQETPISGTNSGKMGIDDDGPSSHSTSQIYGGDRPGNTLTSPQAVADFEKFLRSTNASRSKQQARKRVAGSRQGDRGAA